MAWLLQFLLKDMMATPFHFAHSRSPLTPLYSSRLHWNSRRSCGPRLSSRPPACKDNWSVLAVGEGGEYRVKIRKSTAPLNFSFTATKMYNQIALLMTNRK